MFQIITTEYWENCLGKLAQHSPVLFILFACWFCYCISYCLIYSNKLGHLQRCSESRGPPTSGKQFVCIFLIQIKIQFLWFLKVYGTAGSISKIFHPNSVAVAMLVFKQDCFEEKNKQKKKAASFSYRQAVKTQASHLPGHPSGPGFPLHRARILTWWEDPRQESRDERSQV